jgi:hypothetical protein
VLLVALLVATAIGGREGHPANNLIGGGGRSSVNSFTAEEY